MLNSIDSIIKPVVADLSCEPVPQAGHNHEQIDDQLWGGPHLNSLGSSSSPPCACPALSTTRCISAHACKDCLLTFLTRNTCWCIFIHLFVFVFLLVVRGPSFHACDDGLVEIQSRRTICAENEVEANKLANNYRVSRMEANVESLPKTGHIL